MNPMLIEYIDEAMKLAEYELLEDKSFYGEIPGLDGVWANANKLEDCRAELQEVLEGWLIMRLRHAMDIPKLAGISLYAEEAV